MNDSAKKFKNAIINWLIDFVEVPNENLNGWEPCPFARKARLRNKIKFTFVEKNNFEETISKSINCTDQLFEIEIIGTLPNSFTINELNKLKLDIRNKYAHKDVWVLFDHPEIPDIINQTVMNQGKYILAFVQNRTALNSAHLSLERKGYFDHWDKDKIKKLIKGR